MFNRKPNSQGTEPRKEEERPVPRTSTPMATEDLIARKPRPDIPRPRHDPRPAQQAPVDDTASKLLVGAGISLKGEVTDCAELVIQGQVDARVEAESFTIAEGGVYSGECHVRNADIAGQFEGTLNCRERLVVRATGRLKGVLRYGQVEIEAGGRIAGEIQEFDESAASGPAASPRPLLAGGSESA